MKICQGKIVELDPTKWYWLVVDAKKVLPGQLDNLFMENGRIILTHDIDSIEFVENPDRIKGIIVKEF